MSFSQTSVAPSPLPDQMGGVLHDGGCTFRAWALFATSFAVKIWGADGTSSTVAMARDTADGYGSDVWSVFVPGVAAETNYRFVIGFNGASFERVDPFARSILFPNWSDATQDDSDARSVVCSRDFDWKPPFNHFPEWRRRSSISFTSTTFFDPSQGSTSQPDRRPDRPDPISDPVGNQCGSVSSVR